MKKKTEEVKSQNPADQKSSEDFYYDELGRVVFTTHYHLKRGYCCKSGCRHCPYGFKKDNNDG